MFEQLTNAFIISQILVGIAIIFDFLSFQFKDRKRILILLTISASLVGTHYLLLGKTGAFYLILLGIISFIVGAFTHNKKILSVFFVLYIIAFLLNYKESTDIVIFIGLFIFLISKFQKHDKNLRLLMMVGTSFVIYYNILIFTPVGVLLESIFLGSNFIGYYKHYLRKKLV